MIVDQAVYREGHRIPCGDLSDELDGLRRAGHGFIWIGLKDPTDAEFALVSQELKLHPLAVEDAIKGTSDPSSTYMTTRSSWCSRRCTTSTRPQTSRPAR